MMILDESINRGSDACGETPQGPPKEQSHKDKDFQGKSHYKENSVTILHPTLGGQIKA